MANVPPWRGAMALAARRGGGAAGAVSAITSLTILSSVPLLDQTGDYGDATVRIGVDGNSWVAKATMPFLVGQTFDPTKITFSLSDPGFDGVGSTTVARTVTGRLILRRQWTPVTNPNPIVNFQQSNDGVTLTVYFSLSDDVYQGTTVTAAAAAAGFYGPSASGAINGTVNLSTLAYEKPLFAWVNTQQERSAAGSFNVEAVAFHRRPQQGRQVGRIEFICADSSAHTAPVQTANATSLSALQTKGQIAEVYKAVISQAALTQGDLCFVNARVYPWLGDASAVLDLLVDGLAPAGLISTVCPQTPLRVLNDKTGGYGGANAAVKIGAAGGTVQATYALAITTPFPTHVAAIAACAAYNNVNKGHNDHSGSTIWLMETTPGAGAVHTLTDFSATPSGNCLTDMRVDPAATGAVSCLLNVIATGNSSMTRWFTDFNQVTNGIFDGGNVTVGNTVLIFENCTLTNPTGFPINYRNGYSSFRNVTLAGAGEQPFEGISTTRTQCAAAIGCVMNNPTSGATVLARVTIGNNFAQANLAENTTNPNLDTYDGSVHYNDLFFAIQTSNDIGEPAYVRGLVLVQCVYERAVNASFNGLGVGGDSFVSPVGNVVMQYLTLPGIDSTARLNHMYSEDSGDQGIGKRCNRRFLLLYQFNTKSDTEIGFSTVTGRVGNWHPRYTVGDVGNVVLTGSASGAAPDPQGSSWLGEVWPANTYNVGAGNVTWVNNQSGIGNPGNGNYQLTGITNAAYGQVPAGLAGLTKDIAGNPRLNNGLGAAGAYERP